MSFPLSWQRPNRSAQQIARDYIAWRLGRATDDAVNEPCSVLPVPPTERHLQATWYDSAFRPTHLRTTEGAQVEVVKPGEWNLGAGPDFLQAELLIDGQRIRGDVEVHLSPADWSQHGHGRDERYRHVIAHITWFAGSRPSSLPCGAVSIAFSDFMPDSALFDQIDVSAYPQASLGSYPRPCGVRYLSTPEVVYQLLSAAGTYRIHSKVSRFHHALNNGTPPEQVLYSAVLTALGHKQYTQSFHCLADRVRPNDGESRESLLAALLGEAGLLPQQIDDLDEETSSMVRRLWDLWFPRSNGPLPRPLPKGRGAVRPANAPARRLAAAATMLHNPGEFLREFEAIEPKGKSWYRHVVSWLMKRCDWDFWAYRMTLTSPPGKKIALLGRQRAGGLLINALVPFAIARGCFPDSLLADLPAEEASGAQLEVAASLFGKGTAITKKLHSGLLQQGLLQIRNDFCSTGATACEHCPLAKGSAQEYYRC